MSKSIVLLSGGLDSTVLLATTLAKGIDCIGLFFSYGQRHLQEHEAAKDVANFYGVPLEHMALPIISKYCLSPLLSNSTQNLPMNRSLDEIKNTEGPPATYIPGRNTIFLSHALSLAEIKGCDEVIFGATAHDTHYPDCVPLYVSAMQKVFNIGIAHPVNLEAPLIEWNKTRIIQEGHKLKAPLSYTLSCYNPHPHKVHCGQCDACILRKEGFKEAGIEDPTTYIDIRK